ncbi:MAG: ABC-2 transporter permease, partial [Mediterraneibacter sp.]
LKDLYEGFCIKKNLINWLASMIFTSALTAISEFMRGAYGFLLIVVLLFPVMGSTLLQMTVEQDEKAEFDRIQLTYPLSKSEIVLSKYLGGLIVQGGMTLYSFVFVLIYVYGYRTITLEDALPTWGIGVVGGVIFTFLAMVGLVIAFLLSVFNIGLEEIMQVEKSIWIIGCLVMAAVLMVISYFLSLKIYTKKHS